MGWNCHTDPVSSAKRLVVLGRVSSPGRFHPSSSLLQAIVSIHWSLTLKTTVVTGCMLLLRW